jgi:hypothetical protein
MLRLRQVAVVGADLAAAEAQVANTLGLSRCFQDPGVGAFGLHNALFPIGDQFLEIVSPTTGGTTAGRLLEKRGGDGGYMVLFQTDDLDGFRRRFDALGVRVVHEAIDSGIVGLHLHPKDVGAAVVSIDQTDEPAEWTWAGPNWRDHHRPAVVTALAGVEIQSNDPAATGARWAEILGRPVVDHQIACDDAVVRFVQAADGRGDGIGAFDVVVADSAQSGQATTIVGTRVNFVS